MVTKRHTLLCCLAIVAAAACSSSTSPSGNNSGGEKPPSSAGNGDKVDLTGTYNLSTLAIDSTDGGSQTFNTDANDGGTLVLTSSTYRLTATGNLTQNLGNTSGSYVATDTSSSAQRGTLALTDSSAGKTENARYAYSNNTLTVTIPDGDGAGNAVVTAWVKQ